MRSTPGQRTAQIQPETGVQRKAESRVLEPDPPPAVTVRNRSRHRTPGARNVGLLEGVEERFEYLRAKERLKRGEG